MHYIRRRSLGNGALLVLSLAATVVASAQPAQPVPDLKTIAGKWIDTGRSSLGTNPLEWTIKEDGTVEVLATTPTGQLKGRAKMSIKDGRLFYESGSSSGPVTLDEADGRRVLKYDAVFKRDNSRGGAELSPAK